MIKFTIRGSIFTPQIALAIPRRPVTTDDLERDRILCQRVALFGWIEEKHLDIPEGEGSKGFIMFAQQGSPSARSIFLTVSYWSQKSL